MSLFVQVTVEPGVTVTVWGTKAILIMLTVALLVCALTCPENAMVPTTSKAAIADRAINFLFINYLTAGEGGSYPFVRQKKIP